jgi:dihydroflavonol-4-reductase
MDLVIGGCGFIGCHVVRELLSRGKHVRVFDRNPFPGDEGATPSHVVQGDILDYDSLERAAEGCDVVYHLAANPQLWDKDPAVFDRVNRQGTEHVIRAVEKAGVRRLVYTSTESILAPRKRTGPITEETESTIDDMIGPYCRSKFLAEEAVRELARSGFSAVIVNPTMPIGPGDRNLTPPGRMISHFLEGNIPGVIDCTMNMVDVRDVALGHVLSAEKGKRGKRHILSGHNVTLRDFFALLARLSGRPAPGVRIPYYAALGWSYLEEWIAKHTKRVPRSSVTGIRLCKRSLAFDGQKTWQSLGHAPRDFTETVRDAVRWHQERLGLRTAGR